MTDTNPTVDWFFEKPTAWQKEYALLRGIVLSCNLTEELKWGCPCYTTEGKNVIVIHGFNDYCALLFLKGALLNNDDGLLVQQTENVQSARQIRFTNLQEIKAAQGKVKKYIKQAIVAEKAGLKVQLKKTDEFAMPEEFASVLADMPDVKAAFKALTPGRQRGYLLHFAAPRQTKTRVDRVEKAIPRILGGKGLNDQ